MTQIIRVSSAEIQAVFTTWLATQIGVGVRLVILEGLSGVGKSWLSREPFISDGWAAETIEVDHFRKDPVGSKSYVSAIDRAALEAAIDAALVSLLAIVIVEGPIVRPFTRSAVTKIGPERVRRVYLKRMMKPNPDIWVDEGFEQQKHPEEYFQSIIRYHASTACTFPAAFVLDVRKIAWPASPHQNANYGNMALAHSPEKRVEAVI